ncbi:uncharacterized protein Z520_06662 [Fonsecaea multimorphosa CBS 102226]|uniref:Autophagy-related protein 28 n=1 Tax=Fonsecaea multimorphosa CBS 102226 TaxID=1442371 RepID=A0A0D2K3Y4_9EURO|nr:uncharacterized protein Z520_06662 [Fonsecaea multimorphosa CBS 102226]KIX97884.1 hypothetical protein Z520_06662 [Fonsecaea multimorphosa CBS 102226]OAL23651.1 hypothetical protein AYO22_06228 [Fonsecaea multimorphosa]
MRKSFIERIFPHPPRSPSSLPQYEDDLSVSSSRSDVPRPRIRLQDAVTPSSSPDRRQNEPISPTSQGSQKLSSSLVRHNDPFLPVERAAKSLERTFQNLLDAQSEGLSASSIASAEAEAEAEDSSSVGSPTPTPSILSTSTKTGAGTGPRTIPIRQPKPKKITLKGARRGLEKSMKEFAALREWELSLIDREVVARDNGLKQASDLGNRRKLLEDEIQRIKTEAGPVGLRSEIQAVELEIQHLETALLELRSKHRILVTQLRETESSRDSELSSYRESLALSENQVKSFLRRPPIQQSLTSEQDPGSMYALKPERRTLQMAQEQWTSEVEMLAQRKASAESERNALEEGARLWRDVVRRIGEFERDLKAQTRELSQSHLQSPSANGTDGDGVAAATAHDTSIHLMVTKLSALISSLEGDLDVAESKSWNLLTCAIGAELAAFQQARDLLQRTANTSSTTTNGDYVNGSPSAHDKDPQSQDYPPDLLRGNLLLQTSRSRSPGESSNQSLEDTLRQFGNALDKGKQKGEDDPNHRSLELDRLGASGKSRSQPRAPPSSSAMDDALGGGIDHVVPNSTPMPMTNVVRPKPPDRTMTSESEDDEPGPEFLLSHA